MMVQLTAAIFTGLFVMCAALIIAGARVGRLVGVKKRLSRITAGTVQATQPELKKTRKPLMGDKLGTLLGEGFLKTLAHELSLADIPMRAEEYIIFWLMVAILPAGMVYLISGDVLVCFAAAAVCVVLPPFFLSSKKRKRMQLFETQLSDALTVIGNSLRAGFTFQQAMESIVNDMPDPIAKEFGRALREMKLGLPLDRALLNLSERLRHDDLDLLVSAVVIQRQVGGNLADILDNIADTIRDRLKLRGKIKVLTASGRVSGLVIGLLPVFILVFLMIINPDYVRMFFTTPIGIAMMIVALVLESIGFIVVRKVVDIKF